MSDDTQRTRVIQMLDEAEAVCSTEFLAEYIPRAGARIWDLRQEGFVIQTRRCERPGHAHRTRQIEYVLLAAPGRPQQAKLALA
jgi:hypothetical protein